MELLQFQYFNKIAHSPTLTQAAKDLHISQPSLSRMIHNMEKELGVKLFDRRGRTLMLNEAGQLFLKHSSDILNSLSELREDLKPYQTEGTLSLKLGIYAASSLLPLITGSFQSLYPDVKLTLIQHQYENEPSDWDFDMKIFSSDTLLEDSSLQLLLSEDIVVALPQGHPYFHAPFLEPVHLKEERFISLTRGKALRDITDRYFNRLDIKPEICIESDDPETVRKLLLLKFGIALVPARTWKSLCSDSIAFIPLKKPALHRYLYLSWPQNTSLSWASRIFKSFVVDFFSHI